MLDKIGVNSSEFITMRGLQNCDYLRKVFGYELSAPLGKTLLAKLNALIVHPVTQK